MSEGRLREFSGEGGALYLMVGQPEAVEGEEYMRKNALGSQEGEDERRAAIGQGLSELPDRRKR
jgi:hypothetical protein